MLEDSDELSIQMQVAEMLGIEDVEKTIGSTSVVFNSKSKADSDNAATFDMQSWALTIDP